MAKGKLLGCSQFNYPGNDIKPPAQDKMMHRIVDLELRSGPVLMKMNVAITRQGNPALLSFISWRTIWPGIPFYSLYRKSCMRRLWACIQCSGTDFLKETEQVWLLKGPK